MNKKKLTLGQKEHYNQKGYVILRELFSQTEDRLVAKADSVVVMVNYVSKGKIRIEDEDREKLSQYLIK